MTYYDRVRDPVLGWMTPTDKAHQDEIAELVSRTWGCRLHRWLSDYYALDWWAERDGRKPLCVLELKSRSHRSTTYPTAWLNWRKCYGMAVAEFFHKVPAYYIVQFLDEVRFIRFLDIDGSINTIGGLVRRMKSDNDREPMVEIPVKKMTPLDASSPPFDCPRADPETS